MNLPVVEVDESLFSLALSNIIQNAKEASEPQGEISVKVQTVNVTKHFDLPIPDGSYVTIVIKDKGTGIEPENFDKIFEPYFTTKEKSLGIGLPTTYTIIRNLKGYLDVDSQPDVGTVVTIYLPFYWKKETNGNSIPQVVTERKEKSAYAKVLMIDDDQMILDVTGNILRSLGYRVSVASSVALAVQTFGNAASNNSPFDVVILDVSMPDSSPKETVYELRRIDPNVRVIVSSGFSDDPLMHNFKEQGFIAPILKPYTANELSEVIERIVSA
jgi:CheY-like chemotaxis protein